MSQSYHHQQLNEQGQKFVNEAVNEVMNLMISKVKDARLHEYSPPNLFLNLATGVLVKIGYSMVEKENYELFCKMIAEQLLLNLNINEAITREK